MFPEDFAEFSDQLYFVGKLPYEKCQIRVSSQKHCRKTALEGVHTEKAFLILCKKHLRQKKLEIKG